MCWPRRSLSTSRAALEHLQVMGRVGHRQPDLGGQHLDGALGLLQDVEDLQPGAAAERLADQRELLVDGALVLSALHLRCLLGPPAAKNVIESTPARPGAP